MPFTLEYNSSQKYVFINMEGISTFNTFQEILHEITSSTEYPSDVNTLWDLRKLDFSNIDSSFERNLIAFRKTINSTRKKAMIAFVVTSNESFGMMRMFQTLSQVSNLSQSIKLFNSIEDAKIWLSP